MRIKLDENLPVALGVALTRLGHDVDTVMAEGLTGSPDPEVWLAAQANRRFLITQDLDFSDIGRFRPGAHHRLLLLRLKQAGRLAIANRVKELFETQRIDDWPGCFVVATDLKIRIRRPSAQQG